MNLAQGRCSARPTIRALRRVRAIGGVTLRGVVLAGCLAPVLGARTASAAPPIARTPLRVVTLEEAPWVMRNGAQVYGFHADLWSAIALEAGLPFEYEFVEQWPDMLEAVASGDADVSVQHHAVRADRERRMDFTHPVLEDGLQVVVAEDSLVEAPLIEALRASGTLGLLLVALVALALMAHLIWLAERRHPDSVFHRGYGRGVLGAFEWTIQTLVGAKGLIAEHLTSRVLSTIWLFVILFGFSAFVAQLSSQLTVHRLRSPVDGVDDLSGRVVGTWDFGKQRDFLEANDIEARYSPNTEGLVRMLADGEVDALLLDTGNADYLVARSGLGFVLAGPSSQAGSIAYALAEGSPHREAINRALLTLRENGMYDLIRARYFDER